MLLIKRITIENFVCFNRLEIEPTTNPDMPLTVIRAENGSGKTTLLRAIRWGMYGERALPGNARNFSLHPADWQPDAQGIRTMVSILFETDGSSWQHLEGQSKRAAFELRRTVRTEKTAPGRSDRPDFRRIDETAHLQQQRADGSWKSHDGGADAVVEELLPWELRDFFVMDADEAADYVGGSENKTMDRHQVIDKTTYAVSALLGLDTFRKAEDRLKKISNEFGRNASRATGDRKLAERQAELDRSREELDRITARVKSNVETKTDVQDKLDRARGRLEKAVGNIHAHDQLKQRMADNRESLQKTQQRRRRALDELGAGIFDISLFGALASGEIQSVRERLQPLYDDGSIPVRHLEFVKSLLERGECVCGQPLDARSEFGRRVQESVSQSSSQKEKANWLSDVLDAANTLHSYRDGMAWRHACAEHETELGDLDNYLRELEAVKREVDFKLKQVDDQEVQVSRDEIAMLEKQLEGIQRNLGADDIEAESLRNKVNKLEGTIRDQQVRAREANEHRRNKSIADLLVRILQGAYASIRGDQVAELDLQMNRLFRQMASNVTDDATAENDQGKATLAMIAKVGLRPLDGDDDKYEIFALNSRERSMPPTEINGASRRILALSFVLALCKASRTRAPLVADSLLNFMSGSVRTNTLRVTAETASQPILLLTGSDLESERDAELVARHAGASYTLTGQWQHESEGGDVLRMTQAGKVSLLCHCGPRAYCDVCERQGQSEKTGWTRRRDGVDRQ